MSGVRETLAQPALAVDERDYTVADVAVAALYLGEWSGVAGRTAAGAACLEAAGSGLPQGDVSAAAEQFRRERRLLAAEDMEEWLERRGLSAGEWMRWVRTNVARQRVPAPPEGDAGASPGALYAEAVCSGALGRAARWLAEVLVAPRPTRAPAGRLPDPKPLSDLGVDMGGARRMLEELGARRSALRELGDSVAEADAIAAQVRGHQADWLSVAYRVLPVRQVTAAREALLCVRDDGMTLEEVAALADTDVAHEHVLLADAAEDLQQHLLSATRGELLGPVGHGDGAAIVVVDDKIAPSADDPEIVRRARRELLTRALQREMATRVRWHDRL